MLGVVENGYIAPHSLPIVLNFTESLSDSRVRDIVHVDYLFFLHINLQLHIEK